MRRTSLVLAALLVLPACDSGKDHVAAKSDPKRAKPEQDESKVEPEEAPPVDPWQRKLQSRVLADSGLGVGGKLSAFEIVNGESGEQYCQVCRYGSSPKIMAVGRADDEAFHKDLQDLDAIVKKYGEDKIKAFAVITELESGKAITPGDAEAAKKRAGAIKQELDIGMPVVVPAPEEGGTNKVWDEYYNITRSRTVMFADSTNEVKFSAIGPEDWSKLDEAIREVIGDETG